uniref:Uncharacterized protein n=1 Tax=Corethron hystrix TaxID=216773 RepID=A0A7S1C071_9STRA|mmetsp:Transcript_7079/g.15341  ORF Transcript_7079/g.15341 Transcript_7079/m.15341 type:complete len:151 (+) Transcript_7079:3-455(+)
MLFLALGSCRLDILLPIFVIVPTIISKNSKTCDDILMIDIPQDPIDDIFMTDVPQYSIQDSVEKRADEEQDGVEKGYNNMKSADFVEENIRQVNTFGHENRISIPPEICGTKTFPTREECINFEKNDAHHILEDFKTRVLNIKGSFDCLQ